MTPVAETDDLPCNVKHGTISAATPHVAMHAIAGRGLVSRHLQEYCSCSRNTHTESGSTMEGIAADKCLGWHQLTDLNNATSDTGNML